MYFVQVQKVRKSLVDRSDLNALSIQLKLIESDIIVVNERLANIAFENLNILIEVELINGSHNGLMIESQKKEQDILELGNIHEYIIIADFP